MEKLEFFAPCPRGLDRVAADEIRNLGIRIRPLQTGVSFFGPLSAAYKVCLWSRTVSRVLLVVSRVPAINDTELYDAVRDIPWENHIGPQSTIAVDCNGVNDALRNTQFTSLRVKDAICDRLRERTGVRPDVDRKDPDVSISVAVRGDKATISINLSGAPLHQRGYRVPSPAVQAPIKEALAAGMLHLAGWPALVCDGGSGASPVRAAFCDPLCGSGTLAIEAACIAADIAPGLTREKWGFTKWLGHDQGVWASLLEHAERRAQEGRAAAAAAVKIFASDIDPAVVAVARKSAVAAGVDGLIEFSVQDACAIDAAPLSLSGSDAADAAGSQIAGPQVAGLVAFNPPYGERLMSKTQLTSLYAGIGSALRAAFVGWRVAVVTSDATIDEFLGLDLAKRHAVYNGKIEAAVRLYDAIPAEPAAAATVVVGERAIAVLEENTQQFANRLKRRATAARKWARKRDIHCYRVYDADLPDYNVAIDVYETLDESQARLLDCDGGSGAHTDGGFGAGRGGSGHNAAGSGRHADGGSGRITGTCVVVSEYAAPNSVDASRARRRLTDVLSVIPAVLDVDPSAVFTKTRTRSMRGRTGAGSAQGTGSHANAGSAHANVHANAGSAHGGSLRAVTTERDLRFELNLTDYLDVGLFLDHRPARALVALLIEEASAHKAEPIRFLNLFAYTGSATVHAAAAGALTTTVDLSPTYIAWAKRNLVMNGFRPSASHDFIEADCMRWLDQAARDKRFAHTYDLLFVDPPTYSNSKRSGVADWDVQRDHVELLTKCARLAAPGATILFSCNLRSFKLDATKLEAVGLTVEDITAQTIDEDFARNQKIHHCYKIVVSR